MIAFRFFSLSILLFVLEYSVSGAVASFLSTSFSLAGAGVRSVSPFNHLIDGQPGPDTVGSKQVNCLWTGARPRSPSWRWPGGRHPVFRTPEPGSVCSSFAKKAAFHSVPCFLLILVLSLSKICGKVNHIQFTSRLHSRKYHLHCAFFTLFSKKQHLFFNFLTG